MSTATDPFPPTPGWLVPDPAPSVPVFTLPPGAVDAHCHVFGPGSVFPYAAERKYTPVDAGRDQLAALHRHLGVDRCVIVQATCHGADNSALVDALRSSGGTARGVATIRPGISTAELADLHDAGVRGMRFNFVRRLVDPHPDSYYRPLVDAVATLGWHVVVYVEPDVLAERWDLLAGLPVPVVFDHLARPDVTKDVDGPEFGTLLRFLASREDAWVKVSCPERLSRTGPPEYADVAPFARRVIDEFGDRVLWGTDWPHPNMRSHMPDDGALVDVIPRIAVTPEQQRRLLVDNPTRLYWET